jgi:hypothetical protein
MRRDKMIDKITITLEEYKELLIIKGKYEELKSREGSWIKPTITWREYDKPNIGSNPKWTIDSREIETNKDDCDA